LLYNQQMDNLEKLIAQRMADDPEYDFRIDPSLPGEKTIDFLRVSEERLAIAGATEATPIIRSERDGAEVAPIDRFAGM
jgi:hypothetical protein